MVASVMLVMPSQQATPPGLQDKKKHMASRSLLESRIRAVQFYNCPMGDHGSGHNT